MLSYLALVYDSKNADQARMARQLAQRIAASAHDWRLTFDAHGLSVYVKDMDPLRRECCRLQDGAGIVLGKFFARDAISSIERPELDAQQSTAIITTGGQRLICSHWGSYIAFLRDPRAGRTWVLRSPAGHLPCFRTSCEGVYIYFSQDFADADPTPRDIDWPHIATLMVLPQASAATGLQGVRRIQPGECAEHDGPRLAERHYWNPAKIANSQAIEDSDRAARELRRIAKNCVHAWVADHSAILLNLSGGLDSSIVLGCLRDAPTRPTIVCVNHYSPGYRSDERTYARFAANQAGCRLVEWQRDSHINLAEMLRIARNPEPQNYFRRIELSRMQAQLAREHGASALFSGSGGDQLFSQDRARLAAADYLYRRRVRHLLRIAYDAAQLEGMSIWSVLGVAFRESCLQHHWDPLQEMRLHQTLIVEDAIRALRNRKPSVSPQPQSSARVPPGKRRQIATLTPRAYYDPLGQPGDPQSIAPLMSQPLIELCLRIPTYVSIKDRWYRAVARRAFAPDVPAEILRRRSKGGIEEHAAQVWRRNLPFAREMLLDGFLVQQGLLDRRKLEVALSERPSGVLQGMADVLNYVCIEAWIRVMTGTAKHKAA